MDIRRGVSVSLPERRGSAAGPGDSGGGGSGAKTGSPAYSGTQSLPLAVPDGTEPAVPRCGTTLRAVPVPEDIRKPLTNQKAVRRCFRGPLLTYLKYHKKLKYTQEF